MNWIAEAKEMLRSETFTKGIRLLGLTFPIFNTKKEMNRCNLPLIFR
jgi:hypothetical protein